MAGQTIILSEFAHNRERGLSLFNASRGVGVLLGPIMGGLLYESVQYLWTFMIFAIILGAAFILSIVFLPGRLNENNAQRPAMVRATARLSKMQQNVTYGHILRNKRALFCLMTAVFAQFFSVEAFLTQELKRIGFDREIIAFIFGIYALPYTLMSFFVGGLAKKFGSRTISVCSYVIIAIGCVVFGPLSPINKALGGDAC